MAHGPDARYAASLNGPCSVRPSGEGTDGPLRLAATSIASARDLPRAPRLRRRSTGRAEARRSNGFSRAPWRECLTSRGRPSSPSSVTTPSRGSSSRSLSRPATRRRRRKGVESRSDRSCGDWGSPHGTCDWQMASPRRRPPRQAVENLPTASSAVRYSTGTPTLVAPHPAIAPRPHVGTTGVVRPPSRASGSPRARRRPGLRVECSHRGSGRCRSRAGSPARPGRGPRLTHPGASLLAVIAPGLVTSFHASAASQRMGEP